VNAERRRRWIMAEDRLAATSIRTLTLKSGYRNGLDLIISLFSTQNISGYISRIYVREAARVLGVD
jgi:hypothetical protein